MKCITYQSINKCYCFLHCQYFLAEEHPAEHGALNNYDKEIRLS